METVPELKEFLTQNGLSGRWWTLRIGLAELWPKKGWGMGIQAQSFSEETIVFDLLPEPEGKNYYPGIPSVNSAPDIDSVHPFNSPISYTPCNTHYILHAVGYEQNPIYEIEFGEQVAQRLIKRERDNLYAAFER